MLLSYLIPLFKFPQTYHSVSAFQSSAYTVSPRSKNPSSLQTPNKLFLVFNFPSLMTQFKSYRFLGSLSILPMWMVILTSRRTHWRLCSNTDNWVPSPKGSDLGSLGWDPRICIPNKLPRARTMRTFTSLATLTSLYSHFLFIRCYPMSSLKTGEHTLSDHRSHVELLGPCHYLITPIPSLMP